MSYQPSYRITTKITHLLTNIAEILGEIKDIYSKLNTPKLRKINKIKTINTQRTIMHYSNQAMMEKVLFL